MADSLDAEILAILRKYRVTAADPAGLADALGMAAEAYVQARLTETRRRVLLDVAGAWPPAGASPARGRSRATLNPRKVTR